MYGCILTLLLPLTFLLVLHSHPTQAGLCGSKTVKETATPERQILRSPNYPNGYFNNELCRWEISVKNKWEVVRFNIQNTHIRNSATCNEDYVDVRDGRANWDRQIRRWCGEKKYEQPVTSTTDAIFVTFRSDGKYTDLGFEMEYWSVPKRVIESQNVELKLVNYILFVVFGVIVISITIGLVFIVLVRHRIKKRMDKAAEEREKIQVMVQTEKNGKMKAGTKGVSDKYGDGTKDLEEKAKERDRVIKLEPALGSGLLKEFSTTPV